MKNNLDPFVFVSTDNLFRKSGGWKTIRAGRDKP